MSAVDPFVITAKERIKYQDQFNSLNPVNGIVTGAQVKGFLLQSQLPPLVLGQIWYENVFLSVKFIVFHPFTKCKSGLWLIQMRMER